MSADDLQRAVLLVSFYHDDLTGILSCVVRSRMNIRVFLRVSAKIDIYEFLCFVVSW